MLLGHLLVLRLPLVAFALQGLDLALEVAGFYVSLAKPARRSVSADRCSFGGKWNGGLNLLLIGFTKSLVRLLGLFLEELESSLQGLIVRTMLLAIRGGLLQLPHVGVQLLVLSLEDSVLVGKGGNLLLLGQVLLLKSLDFGLKLLDLVRSIVGLDAKLVHSL